MISTPLLRHWMRRVAPAAVARSSAPREQSTDPTDTSGSRQAFRSDRGGCVALVIGVRARPQNGREPAACGLPYSRAEPLGNRLVGEVDDRTVGERKAAQVECIGASMLTELGARDAIRGPGIHKSHPCGWCVPDCRRWRRRLARPPRESSALRLPPLGNVTSGPGRALCAVHS